MKRTLEKYKAKPRPKIPHSIQEIHDKFLEQAVLQEYGYNLDGDGLFYIDTVITPDFGFSVFASQHVIEFIHNNIKPGARHYLMDATFDSLPIDFYQLLIITIEYKNDVSLLLLLVFEYLFRPSVLYFLTNKHGLRVVPNISYRFVTQLLSTSETNINYCQFSF